MFGPNHGDVFCSFLSSCFLFLFFFLFTLCSKSAIRMPVLLYWRPSDHFSIDLSFLSKSESSEVVCEEKKSGKIQPWGGKMKMF